jgi:hypothetical protein
MFLCFVVAVGAVCCNNIERHVNKTNSRESERVNRWLCLSVKVKVKQARCGPQGSSRFRLPDFHDIRHVKVVSLSASRTGRLYPQEMFQVLDPKAMVRPEGNVTEKSSDTTGNRSRDRPTSSAAP